MVVCDKEVLGRKSEELQSYITPPNGTRWYTFWMRRRHKAGKMNYSDRKRSEEKKSATLTFLLCSQC